MHEGRLHRMQLVAIGKALDSGDLVAMMHHGERVVRQATTRRPLTITVQAPHRP